MRINKKQISILLTLVLLVGITTACPFGGSKNAKKISTATDDFAEAQQSIARLLASARDSKLISQEDINEVKPFLQEANRLNGEAIAYGRKLLKNPNDVATETDLIETINKISAVLVRANNAGLFRIKDQNTRNTFSTFIALMQASATTIVTIIESRRTEGK